MNIITIIIDAIIAWFAGIWIFAQIVGSFQHFQPKRIITIVINILVFALVYSLVKHFLSAGMIGFVIGSIAAFIRILLAGNIE